MEDIEIQRVLSEWRVDISVPPAFNSEVWRRLERARPEPRAEVFLAWLNQFLSKRSVVVSIAAVSLMVGLGIGQAHASRDLQLGELELKSLYLQSVDPYAKPLSR